jgi:nitrite reductase/ring-hydroxylating ferredoxin subunit
MDNQKNELTPCSKEPDRSCICEHPCAGATQPEGNGEEEGMSRAVFVRSAFVFTVVCWGGVASVPVFMYLNPPPGEDEKAKVTSLEVCKLTELPPGTGKNFRFGSFPAIVIHTEDGQLHAFKATCTHLGCTVQFRTDKQCIYCACHGGEYDASTGKNIAGPPPKPLPVMKAEVVDGKIIVSRV